MADKAALTRRFLARKMQENEQFKEEIESRRQEAVGDGVEVWIPYESQSEVCN